MCARDTAHFLTSPKIPDAKGIFVMIQFTPVGDSGVLAVCGSEISEQVNAQVMALDAAVQAAQLPGVVETVPTYAALLVTLDPLQTDADTLIPVLRRLWDALLPVNSTAAGRLVEVPVCYGGDLRPRPGLCGTARRADRAAGHRHPLRAGLPHFYAGVPAGVPVPGRHG